MPTYHFNGRGTCYGQQTGRRYRYCPGDAVDAPAGEFNHLPAGHYHTAQMKPAAPAKQPYSLGEHTGGGWYELLKGGEPVVEEGEVVTVGQGKEKAQAEIDKLNSLNS